MLLVAVTGPVGAGKSSSLARLLESAAAEGRRVDGFVAEAHGRAEPGRGAEVYGLRFATPPRHTRIPEGGGRESERTLEAPVPYAVREASAAPPYRFDPAAEVRLDAWAEGLTPGLDLVVMDEFGRREASGRACCASGPVWRPLRLPS